MRADHVAEASSIMPHRILEIIPTLDRCGAEKQLVLLAAGLPRDEFEVHVCALTRGGPLEADLAAAGIPLTVLHKRWKFDPAALARLKLHIRQLQPALVHTWLFAANAYGRAAGLACGVPNLVACERCVDPWKTWIELSIDRYLARRSRSIVANSAGVRDFYLGKGVNPPQFEVIPNGIAPPPAPSTTRDEILAEFNLPANARLVGLIGRLWPQKRVKDAIWAADLLKVIRDDVYLLVVGDGPQRDRIRRFREHCQIADKVLLLGQRDDVPRLLPHFDVLWSPSAYEGQPNAVMEAMTYGVPVVGTDISGTRELVVHGETGFLLPTGDRAATAATVNTSVAQGMARHTLQILDDPALARRLGDAAKARMHNEFSVAAMVDRYAALYRRLLAP